MPTRSGRRNAADCHCVLVATPREAGNSRSRCLRCWFEELQRCVMAFFRRDERLPFGRSAPPDRQPRLADNARDKDRGAHPAADGRFELEPRARSAALYLKVRGALFFYGFVLSAFALPGDGITAMIVPLLLVGVAMLLAGGVLLLAPPVLGWSRDRLPTRGIWECRPPRRREDSKHSLPPS
jgi:hypothetical protein